MQKISRKEAKEKGLKRYFTGKPCKHGHVSERHVSGICIVCGNERQRQYQQDNKDRLNQYYQDNKARIAEQQRKHYQDNKERNTQWYQDYSNRKGQYRTDNKDSISEWKRQWGKDNKARISEQKKQYREDNKDSISEYQKQWNKDNPLQVFIRNTINRMISDWKGGREKTEALLGYTNEQLEQRIEFNFKDGMSWENRSEWHIDHKKPISRFIKQGITDPKIINALSNLQPLWAKDNLSKGASF